MIRVGSLTGSPSVFFVYLPAIINREFILRRYTSTWVTFIIQVHLIIEGRLTHLEPENRAEISVHEVTTLPEKAQLYEQTRNLAILEERHRLAQELHDNVAQAVGYLSLQISITSQLLANHQTDEAQAKLRELRQVVNEIYTDVREEIFNLRSQISPETSFLKALYQYIAKYKRYYNLDVQLSMEVDEARLELPMEVGVQLIRIIQEALINVRKHSGVDQAIIRFNEVAGNFCLSIEDRGHGFDPEKVNKVAQSGFGLQIMAERAESIGGKLELDSIPDRGVRVMIWLPARFES